MNFFQPLPRWVVWILLFPFIVLNIWLLIVIFQYFQSVITIFVTATLLSFILDYPVQFLTSCHVKRNRAIFWVLGIAVLTIVLSAITLAPLTIEQLNELANKLPSWIESSDRQLKILNEWAIARRIPVNISVLISQIVERLSYQVQSLPGKILDVVFSTVDSVLSIVLTLVLTFYLLLHGEKLWEGVWRWLPSKWGLQVRPLLRESFHNYYIGQASIASIFAILMTIAFLFLQVPFGLLFGMAIGVMALFPFGAGLSIAIVGILTALKSFWLGVRVLLVAVVIQQIIESGIAPRLLGEFIGLNPVWVLLSLLIGVRVGGILGLLIAVPMAGFIKSAAEVLYKPRSDNSQGTENREQGREIGNV
jgi:predicted PurR-regulated permease PerM